MKPVVINQVKVPHGSTARKPEVKAPTGPQQFGHSGESTFDVTQGTSGDSNAPIGSTPPAAGFRLGNVAPEEWNMLLGVQIPEFPGQPNIKARMTEIIRKLGEHPTPRLKLFFDGPNVEEVVVFLGKLKDELKNSGFNSGEYLRRNALDLLAKNETPDRIVEELLSAGKNKILAVEEMHLLQLSEKGREILEKLNQTLSHTDFLQTILVGTGKAEGVPEGFATLDAGPIDFEKGVRDFLDRRMLQCESEALGKIVELVRARKIEQPGSSVTQLVKDVLIPLESTARTRLTPGIELGDLTETPQTIEQLASKIHVYCEIFREGNFNEIWSKAKQLPDTHSLRRFIEQYLPVVARNVPELNRLDPGNSDLMEGLPKVVFLSDDRETEELITRFYNAFAYDWETGLKTEVETRFAKAGDLLCQPDWSDEATKQLIELRNMRNAEGTLTIVTGTPQELATLRKRYEEALTPFNLSYLDGN